MGTNMKCGSCGFPGAPVNSSKGIVCGQCKTPMKGATALSQKPLINTSLLDECEECSKAAGKKVLQFFEEDTHGNIRCTICKTVIPLLEIMQTEIKRCHPAATPIEHLSLP